MKLKLLMLTILLLAGPVLAQPDLAGLQQAADAARASGQLSHPDQPAWRDAIRLGELARSEDPESAGLARLLAEIYSEVDWYARAYANWLDYAELSGAAPAGDAFAEAAHQLGFARYRSGDLEGALGYYDRLLGYQPGNSEALFWTGRVQLDLGQFAAAEATFARLLELGESATIPASQAQLAGNVNRYGPEAGLAFSTGISLYELGQVAASLEQFQAAFEADRSFSDAAVWAGRTALELQDPELAAGYWRWASELDPADERSRYFLGLAERQAQWGIEAVAAFDQGQELYAAGDLTGALAAFEQAFRLSPGYMEALRWSARAAQETSQYALAAGYWERVLALEPGDEAAGYFLNLAQQRLSFGADVSDAFLRGLDHYRAAVFTAAEEEFLTVTEESPDFAPAWAYLGQIHFSRRDYAAAALAFETARQLEPSNEEYTFFAMEARRLAGTPD